jgi:translation initiation factor RLI1
MAREATDEYAKENAWRKNFWRFSQEELQRFAALVAAAQKEQDAQICDAEASIEGIAQRCAANIRARGTR